MTTTLLNIENSVTLFYQSFSLWSLLWIILLVIPPGSTAIISLYRLNFIHGVLCTIVALLALYDYIPDRIATSCTLSYFTIDFINIIINDHIYKVKGYQSPSNRRMEYFHHIFCATLGFMSEFLYQDFCTFHKNPFTELMFAELSTPLLMMWRYYNDSNNINHNIISINIIGPLFAIIFFIARIIYHGMYLIPSCMSHCHYSVGYGFGIPYNLMNIFFLVMITNKIFIKDRKKLKSLLLEKNKKQ